MDFQGKIVLVTGGAQGIGLAISRRFAEFGATVVLADINLDKAQASAQALTDEGFVVQARRVDVSDPASLEELATAVDQEYGRVDILVNNAGIARQVSLFDLEPDEFDRFMAVNLRGMVFLSKFVMRIMRREGFGRIVNIASLAGERGGKFAGMHYTASKGGVLAATKALAMLGGDFGVNVNAVAPGLIATDMGAGLKFDLSEVVLKRLGTAREVADGVVFLCSDMASYITGMTLDINGGILMR